MPVSPVTIISLEEAVDLIEVSTITCQDSRASSVRLDLDHPTKGKLTTIQTNSDVYLIRHTQAEASAQ